MAEKVLVTGGAGFIGSYIVEALLGKGYNVRVFDSLEPQVHGPGGTPPGYLSREAEFIRGDVRDRDALQKALEGVEVVFHQAAAVGVGQSMYQVRRYVEANTLGAATLLDILANEKHRVRKMVVASSMSIYGEGEYYCANCGDVYPELRSDEQLRRRQWEMVCPCCGRVAEPHPTDEEKPLHPTSIYAISKRDHEEMFLAIGRAYGIPTVALRYFNAYGPRQALSNPYTGVAAIFSSRLLAGNPPIIYEDGLQTRDFIHVTDVARANVLAMERKEADFQVFNVGSGQPTTILKIAEVLIHHLGVDVEPQIVGQFRAGDIRHCFADISKIQNCLGFQPEVPFEEGMAGLVSWVAQQRAEDGFQQARQELESRGLAR